MQWQRSSPWKRETADLVADQMRRSQRKSDHRRWRDGRRLLWTETP
jgi:hypothetical protein